MSTLDIPRHIAFPLLVLSPTALLSLAESIYKDLHAWFFVHQSFDYLTLPYAVPFLASVGCAFLVWFAIPLGRNGVLALACGFAFAWFVLFNFRGSFHWHGLYDLADRNPWPAYAWMPLSFAIGFLASWKFPNKVTTLGALRVFGGLSIVAICYGWLQAATGDYVSSFYPITRHLALSTIALAALVTALCVSIWSPDLWEDD